MVTRESFLVASILVVAVASFSVPVSDGSHSLLHSVARRSSAGNSTCSTAHRRASTQSTQQQEYRPVASNRRSGDVSYYSLLFPFCCLALGFICNVLKAHFLPSFPYTVLILIVGILIGYLHRRTNEGLGVLSDSIEAWDHIDPHLLLFAFIPPLLFGDSMGLNFHLVSKCFSQCFLLAGPGVCIGTVLMAFVAKWVLPYDWDWKMSFCFGSITAATDPVAVVSLLTALGASKKLTMVIAGESLMNDGIAIVIFTLFKNLLQGQTYDFWGVVEFFFQVALGGPAVGLAFGFGSLLVLIFIKNSTEGNEADNLTNQTSLTFVIAYLSFFVGEEVCEVSGVLACVVCGIVIARYGWPMLTSEHDIKHVWHVAEFMGNTIVFMLSGIIIASDIYDSYEIDKTKTGEYFGYMIVIYLFMVLIRTVMMAILYVPLDNLGYKMGGGKFAKGWKDALIAVWGGLRGAIGLVLCLIIDEDSTICNDGAPFVVLIGGATLYTLVINGTTTGLLLRALGMLADPDAQAFLDFSIQRKIHKKTRAHFLLLSDKDRHPEHKDAEPEPAMTLVNVLGKSWTETNKEGKKTLKALLLKTKGKEEKSGNIFTSILRVLYLEMVRSEYQSMIEHQVIPITSSVPEILLSSIEFALDDTDVKLEKKTNQGNEKTDWMRDWEYIAGHKNEDGTITGGEMKKSWWHELLDEKQIGKDIMHQFGRVTAEDRNAYLVHSYQRAHERAYAAFLKHLNGGEDKNQNQKRNDGVYAMCTAVEKEEGMEGVLTEFIKKAQTSVRKGREHNLRKCTEKFDTLAHHVTENGKHNVCMTKVLSTKLLAAETLQYQKRRLEAEHGSAVLSKKGYDEMSNEILENIHKIQTYDLMRTAMDDNFLAASQGTMIGLSLANVKLDAGEAAEQL